MRLLRHAVAGFVLFTVLVGLLVMIYDGFQESYGFDKGDTKLVDGEQRNVVDQLRSLNLISGVAALKTGILKLKPPEGSSTDLVGGLASVGIGSLKSIAGLVTTPFEVAGIIFEYYAEIPPILTELVMMVVVYVAFILLSAYLRSDV